MKKGSKIILTKVVKTNSFSKEKNYIYLKKGMVGEVTFITNDGSFYACFHVKHAAKDIEILIKHIFNFPIEYELLRNKNLKYLIKAL